MRRFLWPVLLCFFCFSAHADAARWYVMSRESGCRPGKLARLITPQNAMLLSSRAGDLQIPR